MSAAKESPYAMVMTLATSPAKMSFTPALASSPGRRVKLPPAVLTDMQSPAKAGAA
jgi:hypothetical protein